MGSTEDLCDGTLIRVTRDKVKVTDLVTHRHQDGHGGPQIQTARRSGLGRGHLAGQRSGRLPQATLQAAEGWGCAPVEVYPGGPGSPFEHGCAGGAAAGLARGASIWWNSSSPTPSTRTHESSAPHVAALTPPCWRSRSRAISRHRLGQRGQGPCGGGSRAGAGAVRAGLGTAAAARGYDSSPPLMRSASTGPSPVELIGSSGHVVQQRAVDQQLLIAAQRRSDQGQGHARLRPSLSAGRVRSTTRCPPRRLTLAQ